MTNLERAAKDLLCQLNQTCGILRDQSKAIALEKALAESREAEKPYSSGDAGRELAEMVLQGDSVGWEIPPMIVEKANEVLAAKPTEPVERKGERRDDMSNYPCYLHGASAGRIYTDGVGCDTDRRTATEDRRKSKPTTEEPER